MSDWKLGGGIGACLAALTAACAQVDPREDYLRAVEHIRAATGAQDVFIPDERESDDAELERALADGLGLEEAARLVLLHNHQLQAGFHALGVRRADLVQSGLLRNPSLSLGYFIPDVGGRARWSADFAASVWELWELPRRREMHIRGLEQAVLSLAQQAAELVFQTQEAYFEAVAARERTQLALEHAALAERMHAAVARLVEVGVAPEAEATLARGAALAAELNASTALASQIQTRRRLATLLCARGDLSDLPLHDGLPTAPAPHSDPRERIEHALVSRLDLRAAKQAHEAAERAVDLELRRRRPRTDLGVGAERPEVGSSADLVAGPTLTLELPLFDQNQAQIARAQLHADAMRKEREALVAAAIQEVRAAVQRAAAAGQCASFARDRLTPVAERSAALAQRALDSGDATVLTLLAAQGEWIEARRALLAAQLEAALSGLELARATGSPLSGARRD